MKNAPAKSTLLVAAITAVLLCGVATETFAQRSASERADARRAKDAEKAGKSDAGKPAENLFPGATRAAPEGKASAKLSPKLQKMVDLYQADKAAEGRAIVDEILANPAANAYEQSFAAQIGAQLAYGADDNAAAKVYAKKAIDANGLDNNGHYQTMAMLAQLQIQDEQYADSLTTVDRLLTETKTQNPDYLILQGNALYRLERYPESVTVVKQAIAASPTPKPEWQQLLMGALSETGQSGEAVKIAEDVAAKKPDDKAAQMNLASIYMQADQNDKAIAVLEKLRAGGKLTEERDYRNLYALYLSTDGKEKEVISVVNDGLAKGILKSDYQTNLALAQSYYYTDQVAPAIEAYKKAAPLAPDGETYLNLAKLLFGEGKVAEAKAAAQQAIAKGVKKPDDAKKILAQKGG